MQTILLLAAVLQGTTAEDFDRRHAALMPAGAELKWREIAWRPVFWDAVIEANEKDMPVFLWGMNGHPMACT